MELLKQLEEIDKITGDVDSCLALLKTHKNSYKDLYSSYKQYWVLVYFCEQDLDSYQEFMKTSESTRLTLICQHAPKYLSLFSQVSLLACLEFSDLELLPIIPRLWELIPKEKIIARLVRSKNLSLYYDLPVKITKIPELTDLHKSAYTLLLILASPDLLPELLSKYLRVSQENYLKNYENSLCSHGSLEKSSNLSNFRVVKHLMKSQGNSNLSASYLITIQNILSEYLAPPCISQKSVVYEIEEILDEIVTADLEKLKIFIFTKMVAADVRRHIAEALTIRGIDCKEELELNKLKEKHLEKIPEDLGLELLNSATYEDADNIISRWRKENLLKSFA